MTGDPIEIGQQERVTDDSFRYPLCEVRIVDDDCNHPASANVNGKRACACHVAQVVLCQDPRRSFDVKLLGVKSCPPREFGRRCGSCRWWGEPWRTYGSDDDHRPCWLTSADPRIKGNDPNHDAERTPKVWLWPWAGADDASMATTANFGCTEWEAADGA